MLFAIFAIYLVVFWYVLWSSIFSIIILFYC